MTEKVWRFKYNDTVEEIEIDDPHLGRIIKRSPATLPKSVKGYVTVLNKDKTRCSIFNDVEIPELTLIEENATVRGN